VEAEEMLHRVVTQLRQVPWRTVFVGGSVTHRLITDPGAPRPPATTDVDVVIDIASRAVYSVELRAFLRQIGGKEDSREGAPLCRWILDSVTCDIMPTDATVLGFSNPWYSDAIQTAVVARSHELEFRLVNAPHFIATKISAFASRGGRDFLGSKDIEDILAVVDGRPELLAEIQDTGSRLRSFLSDTFNEWLEVDTFKYAVEGYLKSDPPRVDLLFKRLRQLTRK